MPRQHRRAILQTIKKSGNTKSCAPLVSHFFRRHLARRIPYQRQQFRSHILRFPETLEASVHFPCQEGVISHQLGKRIYVLSANRTSSALNEADADPATGWILDEINKCLVMIRRRVATETRPQNVPHPAIWFFQENTAQIIPTPQVSRFIKNSGSCFLHRKRGHSDALQGT